MTEDEMTVPFREERTQAERDAAESANLALTTEVVTQVARALAPLDWRQGLTRHQIRRKVPGLPRAIFLRLPDSKHYSSVGEVLHDAGVAASRAEGEFLGSDPEIPEAELLAEGGPPAWGPSSLYTVGGVVDGGSAEDNTGTIQGDRAADGAAADH